MIPSHLRLLYTTLFVVTIHSLIIAQNEGFMALEKGEYSNAFQIFSAQVSKKKTAVIGHFGLTRLHAAESAPQFDLQKASDHGKKCNELLREIRNDKDKEVLKSLGLTTRTLRTVRQKIAALAITEAREGNQPSDYEAVLKGFRLSMDQKDSLKTAIRTGSPAVDQQPGNAGRSTRSPARIPTSTEPLLSRGNRPGRTGNI